MHELSLLFNVIDTVESVAKEKNISKIKSITLSVGAISAVVPRYLEEAFPAAIDGNEMFTGCKLNIEIIPAMVMCNHCNKMFDVVKHDKLCPFCNTKDDYEIETGLEFDVKEIEIDE